MEVIQDISYGVVPVHKSGGEWRVLLIHQISYRGGKNTFWIFPKGHAEIGESGEMSALRELEEETGVSSVVLEPDFLSTVAYSFIHEGARIEKKVHFYLGYCDEAETHITQPEEVLDLKWCSFDEAEQLLTHQNSKDVLGAVRKFLGL